MGDRYYKQQKEYKPKRRFKKDIIKELCKYRDIHFKDFDFDSDSVYDFDSLHKRRDSLPIE